MDADELVVPTSDVEELEEQAAATSSYWQFHADHIARRRSAFYDGPPLNIPGSEGYRTNREHGESSGFLNRPRTPSPSQRSRGSPPRKRRKVRRQCLAISPSRFTISSSKMLFWEPPLVRVLLMTFPAFPLPPRRRLMLDQHSGACID